MHYNQSSKVRDKENLESNKRINLSLTRDPINIVSRFLIRNLGGRKAVWIDIVKVLKEKTVTHKSYIWLNFP